MPKGGEQYVYTDLTTAKPNRSHIDRFQQQPVDLRTGPLYRQHPSRVNDAVSTAYLSASHHGGVGAVSGAQMPKSSRKTTKRRNGDGRTTQTKKSSRPAAPDKGKTEESLFADHGPQVEYRVRIRLGFGHIHSDLCRGVVQTTHIGRPQPL